MNKLEWQNIEGHVRGFGAGMVELMLTAGDEIVSVICHERQVPYIVPALKEWVLKEEKRNYEL